jgi:hypothetical protein
MNVTTRMGMILGTGLLAFLSVGSRLEYPAAPGSPARVAVYFSPAGGTTDAVVREVSAAQQQILVQAYSFTSAPIAKALVDTWWTVG